MSCSWGFAYDLVIRHTLHMTQHNTACVTQ